MRRHVWRPALLAVCALSALFQIVSVVDVTGTGGAAPWAGRWQASLAGLDPAEPFTIVVASVDPGGASARAGLRRGDRIDIRANSLVERFALLGAPLNGRPVSVSMHRGSLKRIATITPRPAKQDWSFWLGAFEGFWILLFAALIAWRRPDTPQMRLLSLWLAAFVLTGATLVFSAPWAWLYILFSGINTVAAPLAVALLAAFAGCFGQPLSWPRRMAQSLCYAFAAIYIAISAAGVVGIITLQFDPLTFLWGLAGLAFVTAAVLMAVTCGVLAIAGSRGVERQRAVWTLVPLAVFFCYFLLSTIATSLSPSHANALVADIVSTLVLLAVPVALTYAALSRRLLDVGFFLNRAAVFTIVSTIVIGAFILVEWAAGAWLTTASHAATSVIGAGVALGLGLSMRYIHLYVDRFVDRVLFRKRHEDEAALRRFAHESSYITDRSILLERAVRAVKQHAHAAEATILVQDGAAAFASAESDGTRTVATENDPGILALRAWHKPLDLASLGADSALRGEFAFPMLSRGTLMGVLVCGAKIDGEAYAPDESEAVLALARGVGSALDVISAHELHPSDLILTKLNALHDDMRREVSELREDLKRLSHT